MQKPLIAAIVLCSAYAVANTLEPPNEPAQLVTPAPSVVGEATGGVFEIPVITTEIAENSRAEPPQTPVMVTTPAAGGFCTTGNCGPAQSRRVYQVQRPQRQRIFGGRLFGRR